MRLLWITNIPSPYRVDFFNDLGKTLELTVLFERAAAKGRDDSWQNFTFGYFDGQVMRGIPYAADSSFCPEVIRHLMTQQYDAVIVTNFSSPTGVLAIAYLKITGKRYYLESDGGFVGGPRLWALLKSAIIRGAHGYFSTSDVHDEYYLEYGAKPHQLIRYPFTSVRECDVSVEPPLTEQKLAAKQELGITQPRMILSVGQFIHRKGFDLLLKAHASLDDDIAVCIVGGDPPEEYKRLVSELRRSMVYFPGFKNPAELGLYYTAADVFVLPTRQDIWGLVVNEALAHSVPVITTDRCIAGLELVDDKGTGIVVAVEDVEELANAINMILADDELRARMQIAALSKAKDYTIERMVQRHRQLLLPGSAT